LRTQVPVAVGGRGNAVLVQCIAIGAGDDRLFAVDHIISEQRECAVGSTANVDDLDALDSRCTRAADIDHLHIAAA
jgi:hypothetical protein